MWSRIELKTQAKNLLRLNYWMFVIGGIILSLVMSGNVSSIGKVNFNFGKKNIGKEIGHTIKHGNVLSEDIGDSIGEIAKNITPSVAAGISAIIFGGIIIAIIAALIGIVISIFVLNPIEVGAKRFFNRSYEARCDMREITYAFKEDYVNIIKIMFFKKL